MADEPEGPHRLREEWMAVLFVAIILLVAVGAGVKMLLSL
jgi:hypothetical protein